MSWMFSFEEIISVIFLCLVAHGRLDTMLPSLPKSLGNLTTVFDSVLSATAGKPNALDLKPAKSAIVLLVDGLGYENLESRKAHAKDIFTALSSRRFYSSLPSTTTVSLACLATKKSPAEHGVLGYSVFSRSRNLVCSFLKISPAEAQAHLRRYPATRNAGLVSIGPSAYAQSGFTKLTFGSDHYVMADDLTERFSQALRAAATPGTVVYLYVPELDQLGHRYGWQSSKWSQALEELNLQFRTLAGECVKQKIGLLLTADHGMVDIDESRHIEISDVFPDAIAITGDPRCRFIYLPAGDTALSANSDLAAFGYLITYSSFSLLVYGESVAQSDVTPDLVLLAKDGFAFYDSRYSELRSRQIIGQHGSLSNTELRVPLVLAGAFS